MQEIEVKVYSESRHGLPEYAKLYDSGMDVRANLLLPNTTWQILAGMKVIIPTGLFVAIPPGFELQVRPRSGLSLKTDIKVSNSPGTVDSPYRGEIGIIIENIGDEIFDLKDGDKIAQLVLAPVYKCVWKPVPKNDLGKTDRDDGGYGSTGVGNDNT
jgi:dUTP pyrophosphatase